LDEERSAAVGWDARDSGDWGDLVRPVDAAPSVLCLPLDGETLLQEERGVGEGRGEWGEWRRRRRRWWRRCEEVPLWWLTGCRGKRTIRTNARTPLPSTFPSSQKAPLIFAVTASAESRRSILLEASLELIFAPVKPGTIGFIRWSLFPYPRAGSTFSAKVKIFRWSTPPNWQSTFRYSSSNACNSGYSIPDSRGLDTSTRTHTQREREREGDREADERRGRGRRASAWRVVGFPSDLFDHLRAGLLRVSLSGECGEFVHVEGVLACELIVGSPDEAELVQWYSDALQHRLNDGLVIAGPVTELLPRGFEVVEEGVEVSEEDGHMTAGTEEVGQLGHGNEVSDVRGTGSSCTPVHVEIPLRQQRPQSSQCSLPSHDLIEVAGDELHLLLHRGGHPKADRRSRHGRRDGLHSHAATRERGLRLHYTERWLR
jgi:hypothetical protein